MALMRASLLALLILIGASLAVPLRADLRIRVKETFAGRTATTVEYYKGDLWRSDWEESGGYRIMDSAGRRAITVDPAKREYSVNTFTRTGQTQTTDPSQTVVIDIETQDTGERRRMFGHPAHHFITTERRHTEYLDRPPSETREIVTDGWYLDVPLPFPVHSRIGAFVIVSASTIDQHGRHMVPDIKITRHGNTVPRGLPVWEKTGD